MHRRAVLASIATFSAAGCLGGDADDPGASASSGDATSDDGDGGRHAALEGLDEYPYLGDAPAEADRLIVAFEDPGCPNCATFHDSRLPDVRSELIDGGETTLVWRPLRYATSYSPWNATAMDAVLETTARDRDAAWSLLSFYYGSQDDLTEGNVVGETRRFLAEETDVDADAVADAMEASAHADTIEASEAAAEASGVTSTPSFLLFEGETHATTITGVASTQEFVAGFEA